MFVGDFQLGETMWGLLQVRNGSDVPAAADAAPTYRIYGDTAVMTNGTGTSSAFDSGTVTGLYKVSHTISQGDGYERGKVYHVRLAWAVSSAARAEVLTFRVV